MTFFFCWIIYRWKISALLDLTQKALKCFLQPDIMLFSTSHLASKKKKNRFGQIWIKSFFLFFFFFWFREWNNYLHRPFSDSNHMSGLHSNEPCSPTSGSCPWPQWHPAVLLMGVGAVELFACHRHFPASNTLPHMPPVSSCSSCSWAFGELCGTGSIWKLKAPKDCDAEMGQRLKTQGDWTS